MKPKEEEIVPIVLTECRGLKGLATGTCGSVPLLFGYPRILASIFDRMFSDVPKLVTEDHLQSLWNRLMINMVASANLGGSRGTTFTPLWTVPQLRSRLIPPELLSSSERILVALIPPLSPTGMYAIMFHTREQFQKYLNRNKKVFFGIYRLPKNHTPEVVDTTEIQEPNSFSSTMEEPDGQPNVKSPALWLNPLESTWLGSGNP